MRPFALAFALLLASGPLSSASAQWWTPAAPRPCFGACRPWVMVDGWGERVRLRPRPYWASPGGLIAPRPRAIAWSWGWRPLWWRREMQWRRLEAWRRWADMSRASVPHDAAPRPWVRRRVPPGGARFASRHAEAPRVEADAPDRAAPRPQTADGRATRTRFGSAVAMLPTGSLRRPTATGPSDSGAHAWAAVALLRHPRPGMARRIGIVPAVVRPKPVSRHLAPRPPLAGVLRDPVPAPLVRPAALRAEPSAAPPSVPSPVPREPFKPAAEPVGGTPDVPVAPLE